MPKFLPEWFKNWILRYLVVLSGVLLVAWFKVEDFDRVLLNPITAESFAEVLMPFVVMAVFIERAVEVYVHTIREPRKAELERSVENGNAEARTYLARFVSETERQAFLVALVLGIVVSIVGIRVLQTVVSQDFALEGQQARWFGMVDVVLTGALVSGGAAPLHQLITIVTRFMANIQQNLENR